MAKINRDKIARKFITDILYLILFKYDIGSSPMIPDERRTMQQSR